MFSDEHPQVNLRIEALLFVVVVLTFDINPLNGCSVFAEVA